MRMVDALQWDLSKMRDGARMRRLVAAPRPEELISLVAAQAVQWADQGGIVSLENGIDMAGCYRYRAIIPLEVATFDALINGRSGYRAQYYLSPVEGAAFNLSLVTSIFPALKRSIVCDNERFKIMRSFEGPWSKIWVHGDGEPFKSAPPNEFMPQRWALLNPESMWLRAPLPAILAIDVIGTWVSTDGDKYTQSPDKFDRDSCIHERGFA